MQKGKSMQYAMAGVQAMPGMRMNVRSHVHVPDAEAGCDAQAERRPYYAQGPQRPVSRRSATIPAQAGVIFLCAVFVAFGLMVLNKSVKRAEVSKEISAMEQSIAKTLQDNTQLAVEVMEARDSARICYAAAQNLGMVAATGVDAVPIAAPETRPAAIANSLTGSSPLSAGYGTITGSR